MTMKRNKNLNFSLPHNYGGFASPLPDHNNVNLYTEEVDLP